MYIYRSLTWQSGSFHLINSAPPTAPLMVRVKEDWQREERRGKEERREEARGEDKRTEERRGEEKGCQRRGKCVCVSH